MWNFLTISLLYGMCLSFFKSESIALIEEYIVKLAVWLVVMVEIAVAMEFFWPALVLSEISLLIQSSTYFLLFFLFFLLVI